MKILLSLLFIITFSPLAEASKWQLVKSSDEGSSSYIEMNSVKRVSKNKVRFWYTFAKSPEDAQKDNINKYYLEMDCLKKRYRSITWEHDDNPQSYSGGGVSIEVSTGSTITWDNISPDSLEESFHDAVCRKKKR